MNSYYTADALVVGSGAGGAVTASVLASSGMDVVLLEEGQRWDVADYGSSSPEAMQKLYRRRGMTPILGKVPIGFVEGRCFGGSTEINSGFWHRTPPESLLRWKAQYDLEHARPEDLETHFAWLEDKLHVSLYGREWPLSTRLFVKGIEAMGWSYWEVPRVAAKCEGTNLCASGCPTSSKRSMSVTLLPEAEAAGVKVVTNCRAKFLLRRKRRVTGVIASLQTPDGSDKITQINAAHVFLCAGASQTPALLRRSGVRLHIGDSLRIHPMLKVAAKFREEVNAHRSVLPLVQVREFWPEISLGGAYFTPGHLALLLSDNGRDYEKRMRNHHCIATYYAAIRSTGKGIVRPSSMADDSATITYQLSQQDHINLSKGLARLSALLLAAGAVEVYPGAFGLAPIRNEVEAVRWLDECLPRHCLALTTVHAFSSCPMGERRDRCAADSFGRVYGFENLHINDASMLPDSPGVNPQGTIMAFARRNALHFVESLA